MAIAHSARTGTERRSLRLRPRAWSHRAARRLVRDMCSASAVPPGLIDDATLVTGELVRSSVRQAQAPVDVVVEVDDGTVTVRVHDQGTGPAARRPAWKGTGRSRDIVARCSTSWGYHQCAGGREMWASFRLPVAHVATA